MLQKNEKNIVLLWGPLFVGAPVRPNMLNMPKSASAQGRLLCDLLGGVNVEDRLSVNDKVLKIVYI